MKITVKYSFELIKILMIGDVASWKSVPQSSNSEEEAAPLEFTFYQWNRKRMKVTCSMAGRTKENSDEGCLETSHYAMHNLSALRKIPPLLSNSMRDSPGVSLVKLNC